MEDSMSLAEDCLLEALLDAELNDQGINTENALVKQDSYGVALARSGVAVAPPQSMQIDTSQTLVGRALGNQVSSVII